MKCLHCEEEVSPVPLELKATFQSSNKPVVENISWLRQLMAQCYVTRTTVAYLSRFEVMGDWSWVYKRKGVEPTEHPQLHTWRCEFTKEEIGANWKWLVERRGLFELLLRHNEGLDPSEFRLHSKFVALPPHQEWECSWCSYKDICRE